MKILINREVIESLKPCERGLSNYLKHYACFEGDIIEFLNLDKITCSDKIWVAVRVMPRFLVEVFAIDCAFSAYAHATYNFADAAADAAYDAADAAADAAYDASYAAYAASSYAAYDADDERKRQLNAIAYLVLNHNDGEHIYE